MVTLNDWFMTINEKANLVTFRFKEGDVSGGDITRKNLFNKLIDYYDPDNNDYLMSRYVFKELYKLREKVAQEIDVHTKMVCSDRVLLTLSRIRPTTEEAFIKTLDNFLKEQGSESTYLKQEIETFTKTINGCTFTFADKKHDLKAEC